MGLKKKKLNKRWMKIINDDTLSEHEKYKKLYEGNVWDYHPDGTFTCKHLKNPIVGETYEWHTQTFSTEKKGGPFPLTITCVINKIYMPGEYQPGDKNYNHVIVEILSDRYNNANKVCTNKETMALNSFWQSYESKKLLRNLKIESILNV